MGSLQELLVELKIVRDSIIKLSKEKRDTIQGRNKLQIAKELRTRFKCLFDEISQASSRQEVKAVDLNQVIRINSDFDKLFQDIECLVSVPLQNLEAKGDRVQFSKMGDFDLKTALSLFPAIEGSEEQINKLVDSLEFYGGSILKK